MVDQSTIARGEELRKYFLEELEIPDGWSIEPSDQYPEVEAYNPDEFPDDYLPQLELARVVPDNDTSDYSIGIWWLRNGERLQAHYKKEDKWGVVDSVVPVSNEVGDYMEEF